MKVLINTEAINSNNTGIGNYTLSLTRALQTMPVELRTTTEVSKACKRATFKNHWIRDHIPFAYSVRRGLRQIKFNHRLQRDVPDIYHEPTLWPYDFKGPTVMTVHDLSHIHFPDAHPKSRRAHMEKYFDNSLQNAAGILVDTNFIRKELTEYNSSIEHKISVAPLGCSFSYEDQANDVGAAALKRFNLLKKNYFIFVGTLEPRKRLSLAIDAHRSLPPKVRSQFPLIVIGGAGWLTDTNSLAVDQHIRFAGYMATDALVELVKNATSLLYTSRYEGFGLPVLESMSVGTPCVLSSNIASAEVAGDTGIYVDSDSPKEWANALLHIVDMNKKSTQELTYRLINRAKSYSWERCASATFEAYKKALY